MDKEKKYVPAPFDDDGIDLPETLLPLAERLAKNVHEVWARSRIIQGWTRGEHRDDVAKTHPSLVPYEELSEEEKDYDRRTSMSTLKFIISEGFTIERQL